MSTAQPEQPEEPEKPAPVDLAAALASFDALWSPHIVTRVNDYDVRVAKVEGEHIWHVHDDTDEFFLVLDGELFISLRESTEPAGASRGPGEPPGATRDSAQGPVPERTVRLPRGAVFTVPRGTEHRPYAPTGAAILLFEPTGTSSVGDRHDDVPTHVDATTGRTLTTAPDD